MLTVAECVVSFTAACPCGRDAEWVQSFVRTPGTQNGLIPAYGIRCRCG